MQFLDAVVRCSACRLPFFRVPSDATSLTIQQHWEHINPVAVLTTAAFLQRLKAAGVFEGASRAESGIYTVQKCSKQYLTNPIILIAVDELPDTVSALQQPISDSTEAAATHPGATAILVHHCLFLWSWYICGGVSVHSA